MTNNPGMCCYLQQGGAYNNPELPTDVASKYTNNSDLDGVVVLHEMREYRKKMNYTWYNPDALLMITGSVNFLVIF